MASPNVRVNTFFQQKQKYFIDFLSKFFIIAESALGLVRLPVILNKGKYIITCSVFVYAILLCTGIYYITYIVKGYYFIATVMSLIKYTFCITFSLITWKRVERYYNELNRFDIKIGCRPKVTGQSINNFIFMLFCTTFFTFTFWLTYVCGDNEDVTFYLQVIPTYLLYCLELYFYGHLLSLLVSRLRLINYFVETALSNGKSAICPKIEEFPTFNTKSNNNTEMKKLMDLYHTMIRAYDFLIEAIKWQLMVIIITTFISTLTFGYYFATDLIRKEPALINIFADIDLMAMEMAPLFSPCLFGDRLHGEVLRLRELLASRLYENNLDKLGRRAARALLALTETRDLSFSLLRMLNVDISLPFKFIGLLVTYLIILLQFEKVLSPTTSNEV